MAKKHRNKDRSRNTIEQEISQTNRIIANAKEVSEQKAKQAAKTYRTEDYCKVYYLAAGPTYYMITDSNLHFYEPDHHVCFACRFHDDHRTIDVALPVKIRTIDYDHSNKPEHFVLTGEISYAVKADTKPSPSVPSFDLFQRGAKIKLYYHLSSRCGCVLFIDYQGQILNAEVPNGLSYCPRKTKAPS